MNAQDDRDRWPLALFLLFWAATCFEPPYPRELVLQHIPTVIAVATLVTLRRHGALSRISGRLVLAFLSLHVFGARYLYSYVPYDEWSTEVFGRSLSDLGGFSRNHYDRLVHFAYGILLFFPGREVFGRRFGRAALGPDILALQFILATSAVRSGRMVGRVGVRSRLGRALQRPAGRFMGRSEGHGAGGFGRDGRHALSHFDAAGIKPPNRVDRCESPLPAVYPAPSRMQARTLNLRQEMAKTVDKRWPATDLWSIVKGGREVRRACDSRQCVKSFGGVS